MLQPYRDEFNGAFTAGKYQDLMVRLNQQTRTEIEFRVCETPCFFPRNLMEEMAETGKVLTDQLLGNAEYMAAAEAAVPEQYRVPGQSDFPHFMTVDFGLVREADGSLRPKLVEMQAFPSVFGYEDVLAEQYVETYGLDRSLEWLLGGHDRESYWKLLKRVIVAGHDPEQVVLTDVEPEGQKTRPDFRVYEDRLGVRTVDIAKLRKEGRHLLYEWEGRWIPIKRIYNRAIVDELERKQVVLGFDYRDDLDVEWAGHPNWYFKISKFSLPYLKHSSVPKAVFLDDWFRDGGGAGFPRDRERVLLKPLYSFAGKGIQFGPTDAELAAIPEGDRKLYLMQERVSFAPVIETPFGGTQAEIRIMYVWPDGGRMQPMISLARLGRGLMRGGDQNRNLVWVGGSAVLFPGRRG
jgi:hypothetical protein